MNEQRKVQKQQEICDPGDRVFSDLQRLRIGNIQLERPLCFIKDGAPCVSEFCFDGEGDLFEVQFLPEDRDFFEIHLHGASFIALGVSDLDRIKRNRLKAHRIWRQLEEFWTGDEWEGFEHLAVPHPFEGAD